MSRSECRGSSSFQKNAFVAVCLLKHESLLLYRDVQLGDQCSQDLQYFSFSLDPADDGNTRDVSVTEVLLRLMVTVVAKHCDLGRGFFFSCADI